MIHHIVLVNFRTEITADQRQGYWDRLDLLAQKLDGLVSAVFGRNTNEEGLSRGYNDGFVMVFRDAASRDAYLEHPEHKAVAGAMVAVLEGGIDGVVVADLET